MKIKIALIFSLLLFSIYLQAQETITTTGGNASGSGGSVSYSLGQVVYTTHSESSGSIAQGVQQPYEIFVITGINQTPGIQLSISAYPNPTDDFLTLTVSDYTISELEYQLYDMNGRLLNNELLTGDKTQVDMTKLVPATYFLHILEGGKSNIKTFKIIKK